MPGTFNPLVTVYTTPCFDISIDCRVNINNRMDVEVLTDRINFSDIPTFQLSRQSESLIVFNEIRVWGLAVGGLLFFLDDCEIFILEREGLYSLNQQRIYLKTKHLTFFTDQEVTDEQTCDPLNFPERLGELQELLNCYNEVHALYDEERALYQEVVDSVFEIGEYVVKTLESN